jgi:hypothetical protein
MAETAPGKITEGPTEKPCKAPAYAWIYPQLAKVAREHGYALAIHGSCNRDLDLVAVPWTDDAAEPSVLIEAIRGRIDGVIVPTGTHGGRWDGTKFVDAIVENPSQKPHGRLAWNIHFTSCEFYLDVSVMPRKASGEITEGLTPPRVSG